MVRLSLPAAENLHRNGPHCNAPISGFFRLPDDLVGACEQRERYGEANGPRGDRSFSPAGRITYGAAAAADCRASRALSRGEPARSTYFAAFRRLIKPRKILAAQAYV